MKVDALMRFASVMVRRRIPGDHDHRSGVGRRGDYASERVRQAGGKVDVNDRKLVGDAIVSIGRMCSKLFMAERDVLDTKFVAGIDQCIVSMPALAEHLRHAFVLQALCNKHGSGHRSFPLLGKAYGDQALFGHLLHRVLWALAPEATLLNS